MTTNTTPKWDDVKFASVELAHVVANPDALYAWADLVEAITTADPTGLATVHSDGNTAVIWRPKTPEEEAAAEQAAVERAKHSADWNRQREALAKSLGLTVDELTEREAASRKVS